MESVFSFPRSRARLWDPTSTGEPVRVNLTRLGWPRMAVKKSTLHLAARYSQSANRQEGVQQCFLIAAPHFSNDESVVLEVDRYDPGRVWREREGREEVRPTALMANDVPINLQVCIGVGEEGEVVFNLAQIKAALKVLSASKTAEEGTLLPSHLMMIRAAAQVKENGLIHLKCSCLCVADCFEAVPINPIPVIPTALSRNLSGPSALLLMQQRFRYGYLTMEETRKLILLLDSDPKVSTLPLVGVWVCGVTSIHHPQVWSMCVSYCHSTRVRERALSEDGCFLVLLYNSATNQPHYWQVRRSREGNTHGVELLSGSVDITAQDTPSVSHDITILRLMPEMHSTASHTLFEAALQDGPAVITNDPSHVLPLGSSPSQPPTDYYRRSLYSSSEDKSDSNEADPEPLPSPYPTAQQPPKLSRVPELSLCGSCFEEDEGCKDVFSAGGQMGVGTGREMGVRTERGLGLIAEGEMGVGTGERGRSRMGTGEKSATQCRPDPPLNQVQAPLTDQVLHSSPTVAPSTPHPKPAAEQHSEEWKLLSASFNSSASRPTRRGDARTVRGLAVRGTPGEEDGRGEVKGVRESCSEDKENSATRCIVERQEKQLQELQEKVERLLIQQATPPHSSTTSSRVDASTSVGVSLIETPRLPLATILPSNTVPDTPSPTNPSNSHLRSMTVESPLSTHGSTMWSISTQDAHSLSCTPSLQNLDLKSFAETEDSTTPHSSTLSSRHSRMRHFSDLSSPVVGESVSLLEEAQQQQRQQHGGREGVSGGNKTSRDTEMYQNILANVQRLLASEPQSSPSSSSSHTSTVSPHPSLYHPHSSLDPPHPSSHSHTSHDTRPSSHSHTSHDPHFSEHTSVDRHSTSSSPTGSCSVTPPTVSDGSNSTCSDLQWVGLRVRGQGQANVLTHPVYSCPSPSLPEISMLAVPRIQLPDAHVSMRTMYEEADRIALKYIQDGSQSGNVTILPQEVSMATREYCLKYGLLDEKSRQPVSNVLDITRLRGLPKLL